MRQFIRIYTLFILLCFGCITNEAWAKVTYHILSLPMNTKQLDGTNNQAGTLQDFRTNVRVEVLRVVSSDLHVSLPFEYKSPLATNYRYYSADYIARTGPNQLYGYNNTTYYFYNIQYKDGESKVNTTDNANCGDGAAGDNNTPTDASVTDGVRLRPGDACDDNIHIYVTYDVKASPDIDLSTTLNTTTGLLSTDKIYNIHLNDRMVVLNQNRQNRSGAVLDGYYTPEQLASDDFSWIEKGGLNNTAGWRHFTFKFGGNDPYNVTIYTAYDKSTTFRATGQANFFTTDVKDREKYLQKDVFKEYRGSSFFRLMTDKMEDKNMWLASDADIQWQDGGSRDAAIRKVVPGYYKGPNDNGPKDSKNLYEMSPIFNSFAILNHKSGSGYAFAGSKMNNGTTNRQPNSSGQIQFLDYNGNGNNIAVTYKAEASVMKVDVYEIKKYIFRVKTPFGSNVDAEISWSDYAKDEAISTEDIPESLKRKYTSFTGEFYADAAHNTAVTTYTEAQEHCSKDADRYIIYVDYEVLESLPFTAITAANKTTGYSTATWYEITDKDSSGKKIKWHGSPDNVFKNSGGATEYVKESEFAFIGDPYELRIINRKLTADNSANRYVGCADPSSSTNLDVNATDGTHYKWEIPYDELEGFTLRELNSSNAYWKWVLKWENEEPNNITYATIEAPATPTRIKVMEIGKLTYTFKVVDLAGRIAIQAKAEVTPFTSLTGDGVCYSIIPASIRSPFLADETVTFHQTYSGGTGRQYLSTALTEMPGGSGCDIYVAYTTSHLADKSIKLQTGVGQILNVKLNGQYIYWNGSKVLSNASVSESDLETNDTYKWCLRGRDPYAMLIENLKATSDEGYTVENKDNVFIYNTSGDGTGSYQDVDKGRFVKASWVNEASLSFDDRSSASRFIAMMSNNIGIYEVMATTGTTDSDGDGNSDIFHIGRASTDNAEVKIYDGATYGHGTDQLRFELASQQSVRYHLIDKAKTEIFSDVIISSKNPRLTLPADYVSPLVEEYYYFKTEADAIEALTANRDNPTSNKAITEVSEDDDYVVYVTYKVGTEVGFGKSHPHLLKFLDPKDSGYLLEDGADRLTPSKIQAVYPYTNGDGSLNIYGQLMRDEQMDGGSNTRSRWVWFFESDYSDPYHVKLHSKNTVKFGDRDNTVYIHTFAVHFNQETDFPKKQRIVTGGNLIGITQDKATEYAILGTKNHYKLLTIDPVKADLNGDGDTDDIVDGVSENARRNVTSFEQYWKTYNMIKKYVLEIKVDDNEDPYHDEFSEDASTYTMPSEMWETLKAKLGSGSGNFNINDPGDLNYIDGCSWHSYDAVASAVRWNGYNDKSTGHTSRKVERLEHWYQTFDMGDGTFDIENANIPPVLILLDRHGWEIMRKPIPMGDGDADPSAGEKLAALRVYNSPMVKEYKFYSNAQKVSNCHKFHLRLNDDKSERDPIKVGGVQFTSTSLGTLPPYKEDQDLYVTYTVKEEYEKSYRYSLDYTEGKDADNKKTYTINSETGYPSAFIVLQNHQYAWDNSSTLTATTAPSNLSNEIIADAGKEEVSKTFKQECLWYLQPNLEIDDEMGIPWPWSLAASADDPHYKAETKVTFKDKTGFDPYNLQLKNVKTGKFFTIDMKKSVLEGGQYNGDYTGGTTNVTLADPCSSPILSPESYDHSELKMTNQTFMAVQDANGNMQLMPRFDHSRRINAFVSLAPPLTETKAAVDDDSPGAQTTFLVRPLVFDYRIIDNDGNIAMHYQTAGESYPSMPEHFKSPLATDFKFYFGHAAYTTAESTKTEYDDAAVASQKTATNEGSMNAQIMDLDRGTYYFQIGSDPYTYKKVTVTNAKTTTTSDGIYDDIKEKRDISPREISSSFAAADIQTSADIFIRYSYDAIYDADHDNVLRGRWMTMSLGGENAQASGTLQTDGTGVGIYKDADSPTKPATINSESGALKWQWKFLQSPTVSTSAYYKAPDPYAVKIFNRDANNDDPSAENSKMKVPIKVGTVDRFVILAHPSGDYALAAASDGTSSYSFLNGASMTTPSTTPASVKEEASFTKTTNIITPSARVIFTNEVTHTYTYNIITNGKIRAAYATQDDATAFANNYEPVVPEEIQSMLLNLSDYLYYGTAPVSSSLYTIDTNSRLDDLYGLYDDVVFVNYQPFKRSNTPYMVPNERNSSSPVAVGSGSNEVAIDINGNLPYNIIWLSDNMMRSTDGTITNGGTNSYNLSGNTADKWHFTGNDPYAIKIKHDSEDMYVDGDESLNATAKNYMLLKKDGYDYGVFAETGNQNTFLSGYGNTTVTDDEPTKFIPFALSVHHLIYHLVINTSNVNTNIPYRDGDEDEYKTSDTWISSQVTPIPGTTQRDLTSGSPAGATYQLGETINFTKDAVTTGVTYCYDAGKVSLGDVLDVPSCFDRPNCRFYYYVQDVYEHYNEGTKTCYDLDTDLNNKYKGLKIEELISKSELIGKTVVVNIVYSFNTGLETNAGGGFVTSVSQNKWYTFEAKAATPRLAEYTGSLQTVSGYATHYTNDYLWTPLGDPYGFKMHNRYMYKNVGDDDNVMTTSVFSEGEDIVMSSSYAANSVYELLAEESTTPGYFLVHPVVNTGATKYYMRDNSGTMELSETATEWTYGLSEDVMRPYYEGAGNVGGLNAAGKAAYETEAAKTNPLERLMGIQDVVYNHDNDGSDPENPNYIVHYTPGYYRLHNQPGSEGISTLRYASGYLHDIEKTAGAGSTAIPLHFYSRVGVNTTFEGDEATNLNTGFTKTNATQGAIPIPATEYDPSSIFYFSGAAGANPSSTMQTQGLYVNGNTMQVGSVGATSFTITDIGGGIVALHGTGPTYLRYKQTENIYDLKYTTDGDESARWCMEPASKQGLMITTNDGGDGYFYATFCAPYDVLLPNDDGSNKYYAYTCSTWNTELIHPTKVPAVSNTYAEGKFVPAGSPVIIRTTDNTGKIKLTMPRNTPSASPVAGNIFSGKYLEQKLSTEITDGDKVYSFGLPITGYSIITTSGSTNGNIGDLEKRDQAKTGVGFYINANPNKELGDASGDWAPNNRYVLHNKIYYRTSSSGSSARGMTRGSIDFIPVVFDDLLVEPEEYGGEEKKEEELTERREYVGDGCVYDMQGRRVATEEQVLDGTWKQRVSPGIYIINGKKISVN